jgi:nicotinamide mononucleotide transporter
MLETFVQQLQQTSIAEFIAVILAVAYLLLAVREHIACWYAAFVSTAIFLFIFFNVRLYMESALQVYYLAMAVYGWYEWNYGDKGDQPLPISTWSMRHHGMAVAGVIGASVLSSVILAHYTNARLPLLDSFTTWGAVVTTFMVARKVLENWIYWLVIDSVSIYLYVDRQLYVTALLFVVYIIIIGFGWISWLKSYRQQAIVSA